MTNRTLNEAIRFMATRIIALSEIMAERRDWSYAGKAIKELAESLSHLPFTAQEASFLNEELQPVIAKHGQLNLSGNAENHWMEPVLDLLKKIPNPDASITT